MPSFLPSFLPELTRRASGFLVMAALAVGVGPAANAAGVPGQGTWETTLKGRDLDGNAATFEAYYDTALNITWLADANFAKTTNYVPANSYGEMTWSEAKTWAENLVMGAFSDWRLPTMVDTDTPGCTFTFNGTDCGYNVSTGTSEMAHLHYVTLGNKSYYDTVGSSPQSGWGLSNTGPFSNFQPQFYWTGLDYAPVFGYAWYFTTNVGGQGNGPRSGEYLAWAVRSGDVAAAVVPEPSTYALMGLGLAAVLLARKRRV